MKWIHNKKIPKYVLTFAGLVIVVFFALNTYPVGHWFGEQFLTFKSGPEILGAVSALFIGVCVFLMFFHKEYMKTAVTNHTFDTGDRTFKSAFNWFVWFVIAMEMCSVAFRWIELNGSKQGWVLLGLGLVGVGMSIVLGKILHAMMNPTPARQAAELVGMASQAAFDEGANHIDGLDNYGKRQLAAGNTSVLDDVQSERAKAREAEVRAVAARDAALEREKQKHEAMYQQMISPPTNSSNGHSKQPTSFN